MSTGVQETTQRRVFAIGDVQGCFAELTALLDRLHFAPDHDTLWFTGDLVNRGPHSLATLRFVHALGEHAVCVLGNHELHLLAYAAGNGRAHPHDSFHDVLEAPDRDALLDWIRRWPLLHHDPALGYTMIHAGLPPQWDLAQAMRCARELEASLRGNDYLAFFQHMYGNEPDHWSGTLEGHDRLRFIVNCLTRLRYCEADGRINLREKGRPGTQPAHLMPWFALPERKSRNARILFGHWSTLGPYCGDGVYGLDSGCLWGGSLSALELNTGTLHSLPCPGNHEPSLAA
jgi:bis(5'-nucleosyl)-tetraphosphatase (symmetrical)